jgi:VanZ family protein
LSHTNYFNAFKWVFITFLFLLFFIGGPSYYSPLEIKLFWNNGHIIFYFITSLIVVKQISIKHSRKKSVLFVFIYTLILGGAVEIIQAEFNRELDYSDMYRNFLGSSLAVIFWLIKVDKKRLMTIFSSLIILVLVILEQRLLFSILSLKYQQYNNLPILADFSIPHEEALWSEGEVSTDNIGGYQQLFKINIHPKGKYSGFTFKEVYPDWRGFDEIEFRMISQSKETEKLCLKITDLEHDNGNQAYSNRYNFCPQLSYGENVIAIKLHDIINAPHDRKMNISEISQIGFFMIDLKAVKTLYINEIKLKPITND